MSDPAFADNPWSAEFWNLTKQGQYVRKYGVEVAKTKARQAGTTLEAGKPPALQRFSPLPRGRNFTVIIQQKGGNGGSGGGGGGGLIGAGSSGSGPPA